MMCIFCKVPKERIVAQNDLAYAIRDGYPVTELHTLIIPKRHAETYFDLTLEEMAACNELLLDEKEYISLLDPSVRGFNVGLNIGLCAGQTVFHCHVHLIPRREGDTKDPTGGVRKCVNGVGKY